MGHMLSWQTPKTGIGTWEPHWLGGPGRHLYASLHRGGNPHARLGILFSAPLFHEQARSRRLLAEVASGFAALGLPSLRFDPFGTGDSPGCSEQVDFDTIGSDLSLAERELRAMTGVEQVAVLAWRASALPVMRWLQQGARPALAIFWEPVLDGAPWLAELKRSDALERRPLGLDRGPDRKQQPAEDGHLMGQAVSPRLLADLVGAHVEPGAQPPGIPCWAVLRPAGSPLALKMERIFELPPDAPTFAGGSRMDGGLFVTPALKCVADGLGQALLEGR